jgi:phage tail sheath protein FI
MSFLISPGVYLQEHDYSDFISSVASASAALVGYSAKGSTDGVKLITTPQQFINEYGYPDPSTGHYFHYSALAYLGRGNTLYCYRVHNGALYGGVSIQKSTSSFSNAAFVSGHSSYAFDASSGMDNDTLFQITGVNPGEWNDKVSVIIQNVKTSSETEVTEQYTFEILVYWLNDDGTYSLVETWKVSRKTKFDGFGKQMYLENKINNYSSYIRVADNTAIADTVLPKAQATKLVLSGGDDGSDITSSHVSTGWDQFANANDIDVRILINGGEANNVVQAKMQAIAEARYDCMAIFDVPWDSVATPADIVTYRTTTSDVNSSYCCFWTPWVYINDQYNGIQLYVPPSGYVAAQWAYNDYVTYPWYAPMGFSRGILMNVLGVSDVYTEGERDVMYPSQLNAVQMFRGEGIVLWGNKTAQSKSSSLSSINVRRSLIVIEKSMAIGLRQFVGEPTLPLTWFRIEAYLNEYLSMLAAQGAFQNSDTDPGYKVICDSTNNTPAVIDNDCIIVDVFVKPTRCAEYIRLNVNVLSTGIQVEELIARGNVL